MSVTLSQIPGFGEKTIQILNLHNIKDIPSFLAITHEQAKTIGLSNFTKLFKSAQLTQKMTNDFQMKETSLPGQSTSKSHSVSHKTQKCKKWKQDKVEVDRNMYDRLLTTDHSWYGLDINFPMLTPSFDTKSNQVYNCKMKQGVIQQLAVEGLRVSVTISFVKNSKTYMSSVTLTPPSIVQFNSKLPLLTVPTSTQNQLDQAQKYFLRQILWETNVVSSNPVHGIKNRSI